MNHHKVRYIMIEVIPYSKYIKLTNASTTKTICDSLCAMYDEEEPRKKP
jgi:glutamate mutase epsilon subunit